MFEWPVVRRARRDRFLSLSSPALIHHHYQVSAPPFRLISPIPS